MNLSTTVKRVITLARKKRKYYDTELPKWHPDYPIVHPGHEDPPPPKEEGELRNLLQSLPPTTIYRLMLLVNLGREYFGVDDLLSNYVALKHTYSNPEWAITQMMRQAPLGDCLADGLSVLKRHGIPVNELPLEDPEEAKA